MVHNDTKCVFSDFRKIETTISDGLLKDSIENRSKMEDPYLHGKILIYFGKPDPDMGVWCPSFPIECVG